MRHCDTDSYDHIKYFTYYCRLIRNSVATTERLFVFCMHLHERVLVEHFRDFLYRRGIRNAKSFTREGNNRKGYIAQHTDLRRGTNCKQHWPSDALSRVIMTMQRNPFC